MHKNFPMANKIDDRRSSLDLPSHGRVPRWLEDMSSDVERSHSLVLEKDYLSGNNNERRNKIFESIRRSANSTPSTSAKYGRRSSSSQSNPTYQHQFISVDMDKYIVPKLDETQELLGLKPVYKKQANEKRDEISQSHSSLLNISPAAGYNPSILDQTGRKSRLDVLSDQITTNIKDLSLIDSEINADTTIVKSKSQNLQSVSKLIRTNEEKRITFDEEFQSLKYKIQKYKKIKYNKKNKHKLSQTNEPNILTETLQSEDVFIIPELPSGTIIIVDILSTWGDRYYVGLNGIELFDSCGNLVKVKQITASSEDINILPECNGDPRVVSNLLDGVNRTQDDLHLWLTPFDAGEHHLITIELPKKTELAMLRIWNYNKSRIHSYRGAKDVIITFDGICIFRGEIAQACGSILGGLESFGDTILFTTEEHILEKIALNDVAYSTLISVTDIPNRIERPTTATAQEETFQRPYTHAFSPKPEPSTQLFGVQRLDLILILNWGKSDYIGLTGLEVIGDSDISITIPKENLRSNNITTSAMLHRLIDDENITSDRKHMWYTQYLQGTEIIVSVLFEQLTYIAGIRVWNYNENLEMTFCGVRMIKINLDNKPMINPLTNDTTFYLRRAPGNTHYDFVQEIRFCNSTSLNCHQEPFYDFNSMPLARDEIYDNPIMPEGFVFQILIYTTWGDQYYVGLNGLEIYDQTGKQIMLTESNICAHPESVNVLPGVSGDIRTPDKLVDGIHDRSDGSHSWLVPVIPKCLNRIYIVFDQPVTISVMKIWNYLKSPNRGVKEFGILVDDLLIYNGILDKISDKSSVKHRTILFTNNQNVLQKEMASLVKHSIDSQATILMNEELRMTTGGSLPNADQSLRPFTSVNHMNRGRTSQSN